jgi:hypothetical protein
MLRRIERGRRLRVESQRVFFRRYESCDPKPVLKITFGLIFGLAHIFYEWKPFPLNLCYFFSKGDPRLVFSLFKVSQPD